jgi:hypothetical protein
MSGDVTGVGAIISAATDLAKYVIGVNTSTNTSGLTDTKSNVTTKVAADTDTTQTTTGRTTTTGQSITDTTNTQTTQNFADPTVIAALKQFASTAISNSTDPNKTQGLLQGILQTAGDAMTSVFGQQSQSGIYNSSATRSQNDNILARASAMASQAILGYQTTEQGLAKDALSQLATSTAGTTSTQTSRSETDTSNIVDVNQIVNTATHQAATTQVAGETSGASTSNVKGKSGMSVVCTWMYQRDLLDWKEYYICSDALARKPWYHARGYQTIGGPMVSYLNAFDTNNFGSRLILSTFRARSSYICSKLGYKKYSPTLKGFLATALIASLTYPFASFYYLLYLLGMKNPYYQDLQAAN